MTTSATPSIAAGSDSVWPKPVRHIEPPTIRVESWDRMSDTVIIVFRNGRTHFNYRFIIPAVFLPNLTGEHGEPYEFLDREFVITRPH